MDITTTTTWTVSKDGLSVEMTLEDIQHLLERLAWSGDIMVFDEASGRCGGTIDELGISLDGNTIQITLLKEVTHTKQREREDNGHTNERTNRVY